MIKKVLTLFGLLIFSGMDSGIAQDSARTLYVLNSLAQTVSRMDIETGETANDIAIVGEVPNRIHARDDKVYVVNSLPAGITIIDAATDAILGNVALPEGSNPWDMEFVGPDRVFVSSLFADALFVYDLTTGDSLNAIPVGVAPQGILVVGSTVYVACTGGFANGYDPSTVAVVDVASETVTKILDVPTNPQELALAPDGTIHILCTGNFVDISGKVVIIDPVGAPDSTPAVTDTIETGGTPGDIVVTNGGIGFVADFGDGVNGFLYSYNAQTGEVLHDSSDPILIGNGVIGIYYNGAADELYAANFNDDAVQRLDPADGSVQQTFEFGDGVNDMVILEGGPPTSVQNDPQIRPGGFALSQNYPNPFNPETSIDFQLANQANVRLEIFDLKGRSVRVLVERSFGRGSFSVRWDGRDQQDLRVASGVYIYQLSVGERHLARKLTLIK